MTTPNSPLFMGRNRKYLESVPSTNTWLQEWQREQPLPEGTLVYAAHQTQGKGQSGNTWDTLAGQNFTGSFLLFPRFLKATDQFWLSKMVALAVHAVVLSFAEGQQVHIKWPNDIYLNRKKIAGILIENTLSEASIRSSIAGIGINVLQTVFHHSNAVSLLTATGVRHEPEAVMEFLCVQLEKQYFRLRQQKWELIDHDYHQALLSYQQEQLFTDGTRTFSAVVQGVQADGALLLQEKDGLHKYYLKEISWVWNQ